MRHGSPEVTTSTDIGVASDDDSQGAVGDVCPQYAKPWANRTAPCMNDSSKRLEVLLLLGIKCEVDHRAIHSLLCSGILGSWLSGFIRNRMVSEMPSSCKPLRGGRFQPISLSRLGKAIKVVLRPPRGLIMGGDLNARGTWHSGRWSLLRFARS